MQKSAYVWECGTCYSHGDDEALHSRLDCTRRRRVEQLIKVNLRPACFVSSLFAYLAHHSWTCESIDTEPSCQGETPPARSSDTIERSPCGEMSPLRPAPCSRSEMAARLRVAFATETS
jgi:hypothetical protein